MQVVSRVVCGNSKGGNVGHVENGGGGGKRQGQATDSACAGETGGCLGLQLQCAVNVQVVVRYAVLMLCCRRDVSCHFSSPHHLPRCQPLRPQCCGHLQRTVGSAASVHHISHTEVAFFQGVVVKSDSATVIPGLAAGRPPCGKCLSNSHFPPNRVDTGISSRPTFPSFGL